jgi:mannose-6-phosphate isomerase
LTSAVRLASRPYEKVWGSPLTEPWYPNPQGRKIGEVWFTASDAVPILVKILFTSDKLSVQVHPDDLYAGAHEESRGKTEMWHVLRAEPDAQVGIGVRMPVTVERLRETCLSGEIMDVIEWVPARVGDTFFVPAGTIHAIGAGLVICEVQQFSDVTYRLYDYGRPRELHLDRGMDVSHLVPYDGRSMPVAIGDGHELLAQCGYFQTERLTVRGRVVCPGPLKNTLYIAATGEGEFGGEAFRAGEAWEVSAGSDGIVIASGDATFLIVSLPSGGD